VRLEEENFPERERERGRREKGTYKTKQKINNKELGLRAVGMG
jgi:hypothetical protein